MSDLHGGRPHGTPRRCSGWRNPRQPFGIIGRNGQGYGGSLASVGRGVSAGGAIALGGGLCGSGEELLDREDGGAAGDGVGAEAAEFDGGFGEGVFE